MIDLYWGNDPKTAGPYPPKKQVASLAAFNETYNAYDGSVHENDGSRTITRPDGSSRRVTDKHQIKLNFGADPRAAYSSGTPRTVPSAHSSVVQAPEYLINAQAERPELETLKFNKFDGLYHAADGSKWMADQENEVGGVNSWIARPALDTLKQNQFDGLYYGEDGQRYMEDQDQEVGGVNNWYQRDSVPYCTSYECKTRSSADSEPVREADWKLEPKAQDEKRYRSMHQSDSVPYCTSYECKTGSNGAADKDWKFDPNSQFKQRYVPGSLYQSIPDCNSYDCRKDSSVEPWIVPEGDNTNWEYGERVKNNQWKGALL